MHRYAVHTVVASSSSAGGSGAAAGRWCDLSASCGLPCVQWCGHCKKLAPEYAEAAKALEADGDGLKIAKVDATEWVDLRKGFDVASYPTLLVRW